MSAPPGIQTRKRRKVVVGPSQTCPLCRDSLRAESDVLGVCPGCETVYHDDCFSEMAKACATVGCSSSRRSTAPRQTEPEQRFEWIVTCDSCGEGVAGSAVVKECRGCGRIHHLSCTRVGYAWCSGCGDKLKVDLYPGEQQESESELLSWKYRLAEAFSTAAPATSPCWEEARGVQETIEVRMRESRASADARTELTWEAWKAEESAEHALVFIVTVAFLTLFGLFLVLV